MVAVNAFGHGACGEHPDRTFTGLHLVHDLIGRVMRENARVHDGHLDADALLPAKPHRKVDKNGPRGAGAGSDHGEREANVVAPFADRE